MPTAINCSITGPDTYNRNDPEPPSFQIWSNENRFYAIEVTSDATLFDEKNNGAKRAEENFYASWQNGLIQIPASGSTVYYLPGSIWRSMRHAEAIYYRVITSASDSQWINMQNSLSTASPEQAQNIVLKGRFTHMPENPYPPEEDLWRRRSPL